MGKPKKYEERLMEALAFDEDDLAANQAGEFSSRQVARLNREQFSTGLGGALVLVFGIIIVSLVMGAVNFALMTLPILVILIAISAFFLGLSAVIWLRSRKLYADLVDRWVAEIEGRVDLSVRAGQNAASYYLRVGDGEDSVRFTVKQRAFLAFKNGDPYRIYYARRSQRLLSAEWLRENDDNLLEAQDEAASEEPPSVETDTESGEAKLRR